MTEPAWAPPPRRRTSPVVIVLAGLLFAVLAVMGVQRLLPLGDAISALRDADGLTGTGREGLPPPVARIDDSIFRPLRVPAADPFGYPANTVDRARIVALLRRGDFAALERMLARLQFQVMTDVRYEYHVADAFFALGLPDADAGRRMDKWVARYPASAHARIARARHHTARAWRSRGEKLIGETSEEQRAGMRAAASRAVADAVAGLEMEPSHLVGYTTMLELLRMTGTHEEQKTVLEMGLEQYPASFVLRDAYMLTLEPRWGGSLRAMRRFGRESAALKAQNPRLAALEGSVHAYVAEQLRRENRFAAAIREYDRAIAFGPEVNFLRERGQTWLRAKDFARAHADLEAALQQRPHGPEALELHGRALYFIARNVPNPIRATALARAEADFRLLAAIEPGSPEAARWLAYVEELKAWCRQLPEPCR